MVGVGIPYKPKYMWPIVYMQMLKQNRNLKKKILLLLLLYNYICVYTEISIEIWI